MGLEAKVLDAVEGVLGETVKAYFEYGTLWVEEITEDETKLVVEAIKSVCKDDTEVIVSGPIRDSLGYEYAFDIA